MHHQVIFKDLKLGICWHTPLHATFRRQRQAHLFECKASLVYIYSSRLIQVYKVVAWDWSQDLHGEKKKNPEFYKVSSDLWPPQLYHGLSAPSHKINTCNFKNSHVLCKFRALVLSCIHHYHLHIATLCRWVAKLCWAQRDMGKCHMNELVWPISSQKDHSENCLDGCMETETSQGLRQKRQGTGWRW